MSGATIGRERPPDEQSAVVLAPALPGAGRAVDLAGVGRLHWYSAAPGQGASGRPLLLIHSVNAAASAYEMKPLYEHYASRRPVYALDLPGFGRSERGARTYSPRLMTDAIHAMLEVIRKDHGAGPVDAIALSLSCEFLARAALEAPQAFARLGFVSPTGFNRLPLRHGPAHSTLGSPGTLRWIHRLGLGRVLFRLLTRRAVIRYFLRRTYGARDIDEGLLDYDHLTVQVPGAEHAPLHFVTGLLFSGDSGHLYEALTQPVWVVHGVRGDFVDYRGLHLLATRPNWSVEVMPTGALPHFEMPAQFIERYERWAAGRTAGAA